MVTSYRLLEALESVLVSFSCLFLPCFTPSIKTAVSLALVSLPELALKVITRSALTISLEACSPLREPR